MRIGAGGRRGRLFFLRGAALAVELGHGPAADYQLASSLGRIHLDLDPVQDAPEERVWPPGPRIRLLGC